MQRGSTFSYKKTEDFLQRSFSLHIPQTELVYSSNISVSMFKNFNTMVYVMFLMLPSLSIVIYSAFVQSIDSSLYQNKYLTNAAFLYHSFISPLS